MTDSLSALAQEQGFAEAAWADKNSVAALEGYRQWIKAERHGPLDYLKQNSQLRENPHALLDQVGVGFVVVLLPLYWQEGSSLDLEKGKGWIARYAQGRDYHKVMRKRLTRLLERLRENKPHLQGRALVDSAPVLERDLAVQAGLGWIGKNGLLISKKWGSHMLIGSLLLSEKPEGLDLAQAAKNHCGHCEKCLTVCPTQCLDETKGLDAKRCISTWSVEDDALPEAAQIKEWSPHLFGCDLCQDVCPWNRFALSSAEGHPLEFETWKHKMSVIDFMTLLLEQPEKILSGSAMKRAGRRNLFRNALVVCLDQKLELPYNLLSDFRSCGDEFYELCDWYLNMKNQLENAL